MTVNPARHWTFLSNHAHVLVCLAPTRTRGCATSRSVSALRSAQSRRSWATSRKRESSRANARDGGTPTGSTSTCRCGTRSNRTRPSASCCRSCLTAPDASVSVPPDGSARLRRALREGQAALGRFDLPVSARPTSTTSTRVGSTAAACAACSSHSGRSFPRSRRSGSGSARAGRRPARRDPRTGCARGAAAPARARPCVRELAAARQQAVQRLARGCRARRIGRRSRCLPAAHAGATLACAAGSPMPTCCDACGARGAGPTPAGAAPHGTRRELHELRIRLKNCRYALEIVADVSPADAATLRAPAA